MKSLMIDVKKQTLTLMIAALGFVAALIWKDAIKEWLLPLYGSAEGAMGLTIAAIVVTIFVVIVTIVLTKVLGTEEE
jgi:hypothetical protein